MSFLLLHTIYCPVCHLALMYTKTREGSLVLRHSTSPCCNAGKCYEVPAIELKEIKPHGS